MTRSISDKVRQKVRKLVRRSIDVDGVWDMECAGWTHPVVIVTLHRTEGVAVHYTVGEAVQRMQRLGGRWWSHNGGTYDTLAALEFMRAGGIERTINVSQGRVTRTTGDGLTLSDSYALVPLGLDAAAEIGGVEAPHLGWPCHCGHDCGGYCSITRRMSRAKLAELTAYCIADCEALLAMLDALCAFAAAHDIDLRGTAGGSAWATLRRWLDLPDADYAPAMERRIREAYYGGRREVFRMSAPHGKQWDMSGAYPTALTAPVPIGAPAELGHRDATRALRASRPGLYSCTVYVPAMHVPPLPWRWHRHTYYPVGRVSGTWALPELEDALASGCELVRVHWAIVWPREENLLAAPMRTWADLRVTLGKESGLGAWLRALSNSCVGKFAERGDRWSVRLHPSLRQVKRCTGRRPCSIKKCTGVCGAWKQLDQWGELWSAPYYKQAPNAHVQWAAWATARTRVAWRREAVRHGPDLLYTNTDSLWSSRWLAPLDGVGPQLGRWELKDIILDWRAVASTAYRYQSAMHSKTIIRTAGARLLPEEWTAGTAHQDRGASGLLAAARSGKGLFVRRDEKWTLPLPAEWCGDRLTDDGATRAPSVDDIRKRKGNER